MINLEEVAGRIGRLKTLSIPCVDNGLPYVRLDEVANILELAGADTSNLSLKIQEVMNQAESAASANSH